LLYSATRSSPNRIHVPGFFTKLSPKRLNTSIAPR
jgi:hypothetical protein